jgi:diguanylate cyclase (GGDEF)-like protein
MSPTRVNLLIVTDQPGFASAIGELLKHSEQPVFTCTSVATAAVGRTTFSPAMYDVCLLDASRTANNNCIEIDRLLSCSRDLPLVMVTALNDLQSDREALRHGAAGCISLAELQSENLTHHLCFAIARHLSEKRWRRLATHDDITQLPHRSVFVDYLENAMAHATRTGHSLAVLFIDIDGFKAVHELYGQVTGDSVLCQVAARLKGTLRKGDFIARAGYDEFVVLQHPLPEGSQADWLAQRLEKAVAAPVVAGGHQIKVSLSAGIARYPEQGTTPETLIEAAEQSMHQVKERSKDRSNVVPFGKERSLQESGLGDMNLQSITDAIARDEFQLVFQPIIDIQDNSVIALEVFLRWQRESQELLSAAQFLKTLEDRGLSQKLGSWIIRESFSWQRRWSNKGFSDIAVAVNLSAMEMQPEHLIPMLNEHLQRAASPAKVWLEVSSSLLSSKRSAAFAALQDASEMGVTIALDNIGGGDSCIETMTQLRARIMKVDKAVVQRMNEQVIYRVLAQSTLSLCQSLSLTPIASGVETGAQQATLQQLGFTRMQGNHFCPPLGGYAIMEWLEQRHSCTRMVSAS